MMINFVYYRLVSERGEELVLDQLSKDLKTLAKQTKATKQREVMKLLRLALSGLQVLFLMTQTHTGEHDITCYPRTSPPVDPNHSLVPHKYPLVLT